MASRVFTSGCLNILEDACLAGLREVQASPLAPVFVIVPGNLMALHLQRRLAWTSGAGHANVRFLTLVDFAEQLIGRNFFSTGRIRVPPLMEEVILGQAIHGAVPSNGYFSEMKERITFCRSIYSTLTDLREAGIEPEDLESWFSRFVLPEGTKHKIRELSGIYGAYRSRLKQLGFFDRNDSLAECVSCLEKSPLPDFSLFCYGFYDFNPLQRRVVESLLKRKDILFFFPWFDGNAFQYALPTLTWLKNQGCEAIALEGGAAGESLHPLQEISRRLFGLSDRAALDHRNEGAIELLSAPGEAREAVEIARRCMKWVKERGFKFSEIAVLLRSQEPYAKLLAETFSHLDIPYYLHGGSPLWMGRAGQSLGLIFKMLQNDLSRASVMEFITFAPLDFHRILGEKGNLAVPSLWEIFSLRAGIVGGRKEWKERLGHLLHGNQGPERDNLAAFIQFVNALFGLLEKIPQRARWSEMTGRLIATAQKLFLPSEFMQKALDEIEKLNGYDCLGEEADTARFARAVESVLTSAREESGEFGKEGVFIGALMSVRGVPFRGVIVPGMVERLFPPMHRQDPVLLDQERQYLSESLSKELAQKQRGYDEERLLFTLTVMSAEERILFTFPRIEPFTAREKVPSLFLLRLMEAVVGKAVDFTDFESWNLLERVPLSRLFPRSPGESLNSLEYDLSRADAALQEKRLDSLEYLYALSPFFSRSLRAESKRWGERVFTEFDGIFKSPESRTHLARLYGEKKLSFSPTSLETYARCPFRYFLQALLKLSELEEPDRLEALSPIDRGALVHEILFLFFSRLKEEKKLPLRPENRDFLHAFLSGTAQEVFRTFEEEKATGYPLLWNIEKEKTMESLRGFIETELRDAEGFEAAYFERGFTCSFPLDEKEEILLRGRIDRIDLSPDGRRGRIIDYKTGRPQLIEDGEFKGGEALQLPLYLYAGSRELKDVELVSAAYSYVTERAGYRRVLFTTEKWAEKLKTLKAVVRGLVRGIRSGIYPASPSTCRPCSYPLICGHAAGALHDRKRLDRRTRFLERIREMK